LISPRLKTVNVIIVRKIKRKSWNSDFKHKILRLN
jgi:hypothetical protein